jgi:lipoate-protein ligase A
VPHLKPPAPSPRPDGCIDFLCFRRADPNDVVAADGRKIIGSAARRLPEAVLQHGSIVLWAPGDSGTGTSIAEQLGQDPDDAAVLSACRGGLAGALAVEWRPDEPTACEHARAAELVKAKHANADWLRRR